MHGVCKELIKYFEDLGIKFKNSKNLVSAFTHSSYDKDNYERLEFLGDSVIKIIISEYLYQKYNDAREGKLTALRAEILSDKTFTQFAKKLHFQNFIRLGKGIKRNGKSMDTCLACVFEALFGAIYLEYGYKEALDLINKFIFDNFSDEILKIEQEIDYLNPKAMLQEYAQSNFHELPVYKLIEEKGAAHKKSFYYSVSLNGKTFKEAQGSSKKEAQKIAAKNALMELGLIKKEEK